jgi:hypothetical protein
MTRCLYLPILLILLSLVVSARARTWYITEEGTGDAPTITAGLDSALAGDTVLVASGTYRTTFRLETRIEVRKGICLLSEAGPEFTTIEMCSSGVGIGVYECEGARVSGFTVGHSHEVECFLGMGFPTGIVVSDCLDVIVENCVIEDVPIYGIDIGGRTAGTDLPIIRGNTITGSLYGIRCDGEFAPVAPLVEGNTITNCEVGLIANDSAPSIRGNSITYSGLTGMEFSGECHGDCTRNTIAYCGQPGHHEGYPHGGVWMWSEDARPTFNVSEIPAEANSFYGNYTCDIGMEPLGHVEVRAIANYWGCKCPDFSGRFIGPVSFAPWVDSACTRFIRPPECLEAVEPATWGQIKALFE